MAAIKKCHRLCSCYFCYSAVPIILPDDTQTRKQDGVDQWWHSELQVEPVETGQAEAWPENYLPDRIQCRLAELSMMKECSRPVLPNMVARSHIWLLSTCNMTTVTEEKNFNYFLTLNILNIVTCSQCLSYQTGQKDVLIWSSSLYQLFADLSCSDTP